MSLPNVITAIRLVVAPALAVLALAGRGDLFLYLFLALEATDLLDGLLARILDQKTELGARLDSIADLVMYGLLLGGLALLEGDVLLGEWPWIALVPLTYAASWIASLAKFGQMPSYHTLSARASYFLVIGATAGLLALDLVWPIRVAAGAVAVTNLEAVAITLVLEAPRSDLASVLTALDEDRG
ncbi:MAG: CDP-alcohol phosphatidyltransferase family protein [Candidatus Palauibacterales bacterium]|nr:CDP-alcohol phosphatidyltransferase family protein [Candidatus Palauibacterales bacterium]